jgi:hypothetical protein
VVLVELDIVVDVVDGIVVEDVDVDGIVVEDVEDVVEVDEVDDVDGVVVVGSVFAEGMITAGDPDGARRTLAAATLTPPPISVAPASTAASWRADAPIRLGPFRAR